MVRRNRNISNNLLGDQSRGNGSIINSNDRKGRVLETSRESMAIRENIRNTRSRSTTVNKCMSVDSRAVRKMKRNRNNKMRRRMKKGTSCKNKR
jgi:Asp/Glu/hydantoin racemase